MQVDVSPYTLRSKRFPGNREGALLRYTFEKGVVGYADCHPWVELGDLPLQDQLYGLRTGSATPLTKRSRYYAKIDAEARLHGVHLFQGLSIPESHYLFPDLKGIDRAWLDAVIRQGFSRIKVKAGREVPGDFSRIQNLLNLLPQSVRLRIDFNGRLSEEQFHLFLKGVDSRLDQIDFIEDPLPFDPALWEQIQSRYGIHLACDRNSQKIEGSKSTHVLAVLKPAVQDEGALIQKILPGQKIVVTSYLDHPLGQVAAAYTAAQLASQLPGMVDICGLMTHQVYEPTPFSDAIDVEGACLKPSLEGTGFGFDSILQRLRWEPLVP